jgi:hypothetical protein
VCIPLLQSINDDEKYSDWGDHGTGGCWYYGLELYRNFNHRHAGTNETRVFVMLVILQAIERPLTVWNYL